MGLDDRVSWRKKKRVLFGRIGKVSGLLIHSSIINKSYPTGADTSALLPWVKMIIAKRTRTIQPLLQACRAKENLGALPAHQEQIRQRPAHYSRPASSDRFCSPPFEPSIWKAAVAVPHSNPSGNCRTFMVSCRTSTCDRGVVRVGLWGFYVYVICTGVGVGDDNI